MLAFLQNSKDSISSSGKEEDSTMISYVHHYGTDVCFVPSQFHYTEAELNPYRQVGDPEMDELLERLLSSDDKGAYCDIVSHAEEEYQKCANDDTSSSSSSSSSTSESTSPAKDLYQHYYENVPDWVDYDQIQRGIDVFVAYFPVAGLSLFHISLVGGFSIPQIVEVLMATRYIVPRGLITGGAPAATTPESNARDRKMTAERLMDTGGWNFSCMVNDEDDERTAASLRPGGKGWEATLRVRVLHAKVRRSLTKSKRWDGEKNGVPINQEDMVGTLLAFSVNVLLGIEIIAGRPLRETETRDYLALWRYIGWLLGIDTPETTAANDGPYIRSSNPRKRSRLVPIDPCGPRKLVTKSPTSNHDSGPQNRNDNNITAPTSTNNDSILHAYATLESIALHLLHPDRKVQVLVAHLLRLRGYFRFRSLVTRKLLGDSLSDDLGIVASSVNWMGWRRIVEFLYNAVSHGVVVFFVHLFLMCLRCSALLTMRFPLVKRWSVRWYGLVLKRALRAWERMNQKRVDQARKRSEEEEGSSSVEAAPEKPSLENTAIQSNKSACPFSMMMAPDME